MLPTLFRIGPVEIHSYGTLLMLGFVAGILLGSREARRRGLPAETALDLGVWVLVASVVAARGLFVALNWGDYARQPLEIVAVWRGGGLSFHGGLAGGTVAAVLFARRRGLSFWTLADVMAPGLALGYGIARLGCLLNGCCFGGPTSLPWGIRFPLWPDSTVVTEPMHPTQVYAALGSLAILGALLAARDRLHAPGQLLLLYLMLYAPLRALIEVLRKGHTARVVFHGITEAQLASALIFIAAGVLFVRFGRRAAASHGKPPA